MQARAANFTRPVHNHLYGASRGQPLKHPIEQDIPRSSFYFRGGAGLEELGQRAVSDLQGHHDPESCVVYIVGGLPSVTYRDVDRRWSHGVSYEEVVFNEVEDDAVDRVCGMINNIDQQIRHMGATPCFSTIVPMSLRIWNETRLAQGRTHMLLHAQQYDDMQYFMMNSIKRINSHIVNTNVSNQVATPHMFDVVSTYEHGVSRVHFDRFEDGVHLKTQYSEKCAKKLKKVMRHNIYVLGRALGNNVKYNDVAY